ncbi:DUF6932 family protein [Rugamonas rubra]|uniref:DUF6932 family protein n=1 Tax=Rugamonas rubra TaxID=758825 RepID=UPI000B862CB5|nr:hypothetical protein [Rugamonas rubra]
MKKLDSRPLFPPGIHLLSFDDFERICVCSFPNDPERLRLFLLFKQWIRQLRAYQVRAILWVDGSFVTEKAGPGDIDCIMWSPTFAAPLSDDESRKVALLIDRPTLAAQYGIDLYIESPTPETALTRASYWRGLFGFQHDGRTAKGIVELRI